MRRYPRAMYHHNAEGSIAKILGIIFILMGIYALLDFYGIFTIDAISETYALIGCAIGSILGGLYMLGKSSRNPYRY